MKPSWNTRLAHALVCAAILMTMSITGTAEEAASDATEDAASAAPKATK